MKQNKFFQAKKRNKMNNRIYTIVILPKRDVGAGGFRADAPLAPDPFRLFWSKNNKVDVFDNQ